ncbi:MAG: sigma-70 family RNA polymerase sigma factor [Siphonobacter sp.]
MERRHNLQKKNQHLVELWQLAKSGDKQAFCQLAESQRPILINYATSFTKDRELSKDLIQDLFLNIWENRQSLNINVVTIYLLQALRNRLLDHLRIRDRVTELEEDDAFFVDDFVIESNLIEEEHFSQTRQSIRQALAQLPLRQQEVLFLKFYQGLDLERIAEVMSISRQSVANHQHRALNSLKTLLVRYALPFFILYLIF